LLARTLTIAQDSAMRDKRRALGRALANALDDTGTKVDSEIAFVRVLADLDPGAHPCAEDHLTITDTTRTSISVP
jgi:hypothetical protein